MMILLDPLSHTPVYEQIVTQIERYVLTGALKSGDKVPSVRNQSIELSVNPNTVQRAYNELDAHGVLVTVPGKGTFISQSAYSHLQGQRRKLLSRFDELVAELSLAGVAQEELTQHVISQYRHKEGTV